MSEITKINPLYEQYYLNGIDNFNDEEIEKIYQSEKDYYVHQKFLMDIFSKEYYKDNIKHILFFIPHLFTHYDDFKFNMDTYKKLISHLDNPFSYESIESIYNCHDFFNLRYEFETEKIYDTLIKEMDEVIKNTNHTNYELYEIKYIFDNIRRYFYDINFIPGYQKESTYNMIFCDQIEYSEGILTCSSVEDFKNLSFNYVKSIGEFNKK